MAHVCEICDKKTTTGNNRSHSNRATRRTWKANIQKATINGAQVFACMKCLKASYKLV